MNILLMKLVLIQEDLLKIMKIEELILIIDNIQLLLPHLPNNEKYPKLIDFNLGKSKHNIENINRVLSNLFSKKR